MNNEEKKYYAAQRVSKSKVELYEVTKEQHDEIEREVGRIRKQMQRNGECLCPKSKTWQCDGVCQDCPFYNKRSLSMEDVVYENTSDGSVLTLGDTIADPKSENLTEQIALKIVFEQLCQYLDTLDPAYRQIFDLIKSKSTICEEVVLRKVAEELNMPWSTFKSRLKVIRDAFEKFYK